MLAENDCVSSGISALAAAACRELFEAYGVDLREFKEADEQCGGPEVPVFCGVMGFVGARLRGTCLLACGAGPIERSCPAGGRARDWTGELTNQLVGRVKTKLLARGVELFVSTPIVLTGTSIRPVPRGPLAPNKFYSSAGVVFVWVEAEAGDDFVLGSITPGQGRTEGDILIF